ncbi:MAG: hypothetical protein ACFB2W_14275 [Leptolyngbyaceae cyanobacterium]
MALFDWFNPKEKDTTTFEISNDSGDQVVFTVPTKGSNKIRKTLRNAGFQKDHNEYRYKEINDDDMELRDTSAFRWWAQRDIDEKEDIEWQGDHEGHWTDSDDDREGFDPFEDDEESEQAALRFWPRW